MGVRKRNLPLAAVLSAVFFLGWTACSYYFKEHATSAVDQLNLDFNKMIRQKSEQDQGLKAQVQEVRSSMLVKAAKTEPLLLKAYPLPGGEDFHFIKDHHASKDYNRLLAVIGDCAEDGLTPENFRADLLISLAQSLTDAASMIDQVPQVSLSVEQKNELVQDLINASKKKSAPKLNGQAILDWMLGPEEVSKYPEIQAAYQSAQEAMLARGKAENSLEVESALVYIKYVLAMGLRQDLVLVNWQKSMKDIEGALKEAVPATPHYQRLRSELLRYIKLAEKYNQVPAIEVGAIAKIKKGTKSELARKVQEHLSIEGYYSGPIDGNFDSTTEAALIEFQRTHQVVDDGAIGKGTAESMNVPFSHRVKQIRLAMSKYRQSATRYEKYYLRVNIPEFMVELVENGQILRRHRVIVGNLVDINHTPEFQAFVTKVIYNPSWYITKRIFEKEELPEWEKDPTYFDRKGYVVKYNKNDEPISAYEPPGPGNALGRVKIVFPNPYDVYMHDTPKKFLFERTIRPFSHGCIRLQHPLDMAEFLLQKDGNPAVDKIDKYLASPSATQEIELKNKIPIFVEYNTVTTNDDGRAVFLYDVYSQDKNDLAKLDAPLV